MRRFQLTCWALAIVTAAVVAGCDDDVGGCDSKTIDIGTGEQRSPEPPDAIEIHIYSADHAGNETYRQAAQDLIAVIDSLEISLCSCSELTHVTGACWPAYNVRLALDATPVEFGALYETLLEVPIAGRHPVTERPPGYGKFWIEAGPPLWYAD